MTDRPDRVRLTLSPGQVRTVALALREALAANLLRRADTEDALEVLALVDGKLPGAAARHSVGGEAAELLLGDAVLRVLGRAEDEGRHRLTWLEVDDRLADKPAGTSIRSTLDRLRRDKLVIFTGDGAVTLTRDGRARARRHVLSEAVEHQVADAEQLLDLVYRARCGGTTRYVGDEIWHAPTVQACVSADREQFDALLAPLVAYGVVGPASGSYRTITEDGMQLGGERARVQRVPGGPCDLPRLLPPVRRPGEILRRRQDMACPMCGRPASWLRSRSSRRYDELRASGMTQYDCADCNVSWSVYTEPVDRAGEYDPFGEPAICRLRWALRGGYWDGPALAPPDHWRAS